MKFKHYFIIIGAVLFLLVSLFLIANWSSYPKNPEEWFRVSYYIQGNSECLIPLDSAASNVHIDLNKNEISINHISVTKLCDFNEGYVDFEITGLKEEPSVYGLNDTFYSVTVNKTENKFRINLNSSLMKKGYPEGTNSFSVKAKISGKFHIIYEISSNTKPWAVAFDYPTSLWKGYSCDECFSLLEGNLRKVHPDEKTYESKDINSKDFFFDNEDWIVIRFNPKKRLIETSKEFLFGLIISIIAGIVTFLLIELMKDTKK